MNCTACCFILYFIECSRPCYVGWPRVYTWLYNWMFASQGLLHTERTVANASISPAVSTMGNFMFQVWHFPHPILFYCMTTTLLVNQLLNCSVNVFLQKTFRNLPLVTELSPSKDKVSPCNISQIIPFHFGSLISRSYIFGY